MKILDKLKKDRYSDLLERVGQYKQYRDKRWSYSVQEGVYNDSSKKCYAS